MGKFSKNRLDAVVTALILSSATGLGLLSFGATTATADVIFDTHGVNTTQGDPRQQQRTQMLHRFRP